MSFDDYTVSKMSSKVGKQFIIEHHYSKGCHNGPMCYGLYRDGALVGVCAFATPCSEAVRASVFGKEYVNTITELHRLVLLDDVPKNGESWFVSRALKLLKADKPHICGVLSFADSTESHVGYIYQALNFIYCGQNGRSTFYRDEEGRLRHPRQNGHNITVRDAISRGWVPETRNGKYRYLILLPNNRAHRKELMRTLKLKIESKYPKAAE